MEPKTFTQARRMSEDEARAYLESIRWPDGKPACPHCGVVDRATRLEGGSTRPGVWKCKDCRKPFSVTVGTVMQGSHIPIADWVVAFHLVAASKKAISALQLQRMLGLGSYKSAWHMAHRIRTAMANAPEDGPLTGEVEADEVFIQGKPRFHVDPRTAARRLTKDARPVAVLVQRDGPARARAIKRVTTKNLRAFIRENVDCANATLNTDEAKPYRAIGKEFGGGHRRVHHARGEYARPDGAGSNTAESYNAMTKRCIMGAWQHISRQHAQKYLNEISFRWSHRKATDSERAVTALRQGDGVRLAYRA